MINAEYVEKLRTDITNMELEMSKPEVSSDRKKYREITTKYAHQKKVLAVAERLHTLKTTIAESDELLADPNLDPEYKEMAEDEKATAESQLSDAEQAMKIALLPPDPREGANVIMEIRAGTGGDEAALFAGDLYRMYNRFSDSNGWKAELLDASMSELGGYKEVTFCITGDDAFRRLQFESGVHRVQRVPATETQGRVHTSAATVAVLAEAEEVEINIKAEDLRIEYFRSSGPGGQSVNTTDSAVRITHTPTGVVATCQDEKSQHRNKDKAMRVLRARILDQRQREEAEKHASERRSQIGSGDRSERIRTYNFPENRVSDHRINLTLYSLNKTMEGELAPLSDALYNSDIEARMKARLEGKDND